MKKFPVFQKMKVKQISKAKAFVLILSTFAFIFFAVSCNPFEKQVVGEYFLSLKLKMEDNSNNQHTKRVVDILKLRLLKYGIKEQNIKIDIEKDILKLDILMVDNPTRVTNILTKTGSLEFWETYSIKDVYDAIIQADKIIAEKLDTAKAIKKEVKSEKVAKAGELNMDAVEESYQPEVERLFTYFRPNIIQENSNYASGNGPVIGTGMIADTAKINAFLNLPEISCLFPRNLRFVWGIKPPNYSDNKEFLELFAIKISNFDGTPPLDDKVIVSVKKDKDTDGQISISMSMNAEGASMWRTLTGQHINEAIAIVLDDYVYSAPNVSCQIEGGKSQISGFLTDEEVDDLVIVLSNGKLPIKLTPIEKTITK